MKHLCPKREILARHVKLRDIDFQYIFLSVELFLFGLVGVYFGVQFYDSVCNSVNEACGYLLAGIYFAGLLMVLSTVLAIREIRG
jgi:LytS/YehU family sensor histidine kinase